MTKTATEPAKKLGIHAFTATIFNGMYIIGRADLCVDGYTPMDLGIFKTYAEASDAADKLNEKLGLSIDDAARIIGTTMHRKSPAQEIVDRLNELLPKRSGGQLDMESIEDYLMNEDGVENIREAASEEE